MFVLVADNRNVLRVALARNDVVCFLAPDWLRATGVELRVTARRANCATKETLYKIFAIVENRLLKSYRDSCFKPQYMVQEYIFTHFLTFLLTVVENI